MNETKKSSKILSVLLTLLMLVSMPGVTAFAETLVSTEESRTDTVLYADGTLVINEDEMKREENTRTHGEVTNTYGEVKNGFESESDIPWIKEAKHIKRVEIGSELKISSTKYMLAGLKNLESTDLKLLDTSETSDMSYMFAGTNILSSAEKTEIKVKENCNTENMFLNSDAESVISVIPQETHKEVKAEEQTGETEDTEIKETEIGDIAAGREKKGSGAALYAARSSTYASSGVVKNGYVAVKNGGTPTYGGTWVCQVDDGNSPILDACCCDPNAGTNPANGVRVNMSRYSNSSIQARMAYVCYKNWGSATNDQKYSLSRACGIATGAISLGGYGYQNRAQVERFYNQAKNMSSAPDGFEAYLCRPTNGTQNQLAWRNKPIGKLKIEKGVQGSEDVVKNNSSFYSLQGAEFGVYSDSRCKTLVKKLTTGAEYSNSKGWLAADTSTIELKAGTYYVKETKAPKGYVLNSDVKTVTIKAGETTSIRIADAPQRCYLQIKKSNSMADNKLFSNLSLAGAEYKVYLWSEHAKAQTNAIATLKTDENGFTSTITLPPRSNKEVYYIRESKAPAGFRLNPEIKSHSFPHAEAYQFKVTDIPLHGTVTLKKKVASNEHLVKDCHQRYNLKGAEYSVYKTEADALNNRNNVGKLITTEQKTGADGKLYAESNSLALPPATYYVKETKAPEGYYKDNSIYSVNVTNGNDSVVNVSDDPQFDPLRLKLSKHIPAGKNWTKKYLENAEYTVKYYPEYYGSEKELNNAKLMGVRPLRTWVFKTDVNGTIKIGDEWYVGGQPLFRNSNGKVVGLYGTYVFEETKAPPGFIKNDGITIRQIHQGIEPDYIDDTNHGDAKNVAAEDLENPTTKSLTVGKKISKDNVYKPYGYPTAIFEIEGTDVYGNTIIYHEAVTLDEKNFDGTNYYAEFTLNNLPAGEYKVSEIKTSRYKFKNATVMTGEGTLTGETVLMNLINNHTGKVVFENEISRWNDYSHSHCIVNKF